MLTTGYILGFEEGPAFAAVKNLFWIRETAHFGHGPGSDRHGRGQHSRRGRRRGLERR